MYLSPQDRKVINGPETLFSIMQNIFKRELKIIPKRLHYFWVLSLSKEYRLYDLCLIPQKSIDDGSIAMPDIYSYPVQSKARHVIIVQTSVQKDWGLNDDLIKLKERIKAAGQTLDISLMEYMLINEDAFYSLGENGKL